MNIVAQIIGFIAFGFSLFTYHQKGKVNILNNALVVNFLKLVHYLLLGAYSGFATKVVAIFRDLFVIVKERNSFFGSKLYFYIFIFLYLVISVITYDGFLSLLPIIAALTYMLVIWDGNDVKIRRIALLGYFLWLGYNIFVFSLSGIFSNVVSIMSVSFAIYKDNRQSIFS